MRTSDQPTKVIKAFASEGSKNTIPVDATTATQSSGEAAFTTGFPDITMQPESAGGVPPDGKDMNGILFSLSAIARWAGAGMSFTFDDALSQAVGGYAKGALVFNSAFDGFWKNTVDNNTTNPEPNNASLTGWIPDSVYGLTIITTSSSTTLNALQASRPRIGIAGALNSSINVVLPAWTYSWTISNNTTGGFSVIVKTSADAGVTIPPGSTVKVYGNGASIQSEFGPLAFQSVAPVSMGGTGSTTPATARSALGLGSIAVENVAPLSKGGTGAQDAAAARSNLSIYSRAESDARFSPIIPAYASVGSYIIAMNTGDDILPNTTVSGSQLRASTADGNTSGGALPGSWRTHGYSETTNLAHRTTLFIRVS